MNKNQKICLVCGALLIILTILFPPWTSTLKTKDYYSQQPIGYHFIGKPPVWEDPRVGHIIDTTRLLIQGVAILMLTGLAIFIFNSSQKQKSIESLPSQKNADVLNRQPTTPSRFKGREDYEAWKSERLQLIPQKKNLRSPRLFSLKSIFIAVIITSVLVFFMAVIDTTGKPPQGIQWTIMWMVLTVEMWKHWKWKALIPYPFFVLCASGTMIVLSEIGTDLLAMQIIKGAINVACITVFFIIYYRRFRKEKAKSRVFERVRKNSAIEIPVSN